MAKKKKKLYILNCSDCSRTNYFSLLEKEKEQNKFCRWCKKHTKHLKKKR